MKQLVMSLAYVALIGCGSSSGGGSSPAGPMRSTPSDHKLDAAAPLDINERKLMLQWIQERMDSARAGHRERVRLPAIKRKAQFGCDDCPTFAIAAAAGTQPFYWLDLQDRTSAGLPPDEWSGWAEGHFTGEERNHGGLALPVFELTVVRERSLGDQPVVRVVPD